MPDLATTSARIDDLLSQFEQGDRELAARVGELLTLVAELYGSGLSRIVDLLSEQPELLDKLAADEQVAGLLSLHGLHPSGVTERVQRALDQVRPYLGSHAGGVELLGVDSDGVARLRLQGTCDGCASSTVTVKLAIERAIFDAVPEVTRVDVANLTTTDTPRSGSTGAGSGSPLIPVEALFSGGDIRHGVTDHEGATGSTPPGYGAGDTANTAWADLPDLRGLGEGQVRAVQVSGVPVVVCAANGQRYAYRDRCPRCQGGFAGARLTGVLLACPVCGARYDVALAGRSPDHNLFHLDPLPLLGDPDNPRIAVGATLGAPA